MAFLLLMAWQRQDVGTYLSARKQMQFADAGVLPTWRTGPMTAKTCQSGDDCFNLLHGRAAAAPVVDLASMPLSFPTEVGGPDLAVTLAQTQLKPQHFEALSQLRTLVLTLPSFSYRRADLYFDGRHRATYYDGAILSVSFDPSEVAARGVDIDVVFELRGNQTRFSLAGQGGMNRVERNMVVMSSQEFADYQEFVASNRAGRGDYVGMIARVVMAVFVLILFLLVDGSPESLGLGLFLGFEAAAISLRFGWIPLANPTFFQHFCYQMGDIFRLFFFLQLARLIDKRVGRWLLWGAVLSVPYGLLRHYQEVLGVTWPTRIPLYRDMLAGGLGVIVLVRASIYLWDKKLPWRVLALIVAAMGAFEQVVDPLVSHFPTLHTTTWMTTFIDVLQPAGVWLLAFSAFINISTLENRVKVLSRVEARAKEIQHEMELGRTVQRAFLTVPALPPGCRLAYHHEAMLYVSGDTYFVNWNKQHGRLSFLINDVTGHGIQAALKASAASVIAKTLWDDAKPEWTEGKLKSYDEQLHNFLGQMSDEPDIPALGGAEFDTTTGEVKLYRANFPFPLVIEPVSELKAADEHLGELWRPQFLALPNRQVVTRKLSPGSIIVLTSDGFLDTSRRAREFLLYLRRFLSTKDASLSAETIKTLFLRCELFEKDVTPDDRTLMVFQWDKDSYAKVGTSDVAS